jgi:hypothetical protein
VPISKASLPVWCRAGEVSDGNSAHSDAEHTATLAALYAVFGDVMDTDMIIACLHKNATRVAAVAV